LVACASGYTAFDSRHGSLLESGKRQHRAYGLDVRRMNLGGGTQLTLVLGRLLGEDVALERLGTLDGATRANGEALGSTPLRFHLGHDAFLRVSTRLPGAT